MNRLPEKRAINFITKRKFIWTARIGHVEPKKELTEKNWLGRFCFCFSIHRGAVDAIQNQYSRLFAHIFHHINIPSMRWCVPSFHRFNKLKIHASLCLFEQICAFSIHTSMCVCVCNLICFVYAFPKTRWSIFVMPPPFRLVAQRVRKRIWCPGTGCYGTRCHVHVAGASVVNSSSMCFICGHPEPMWVCAPLCTRILASEPEIERSENKLGKDDSLFNSTHEQPEIECDRERERARVGMSQNNKRYTHFVCVRGGRTVCVWGRICAIHDFG